MGFGLYGSWALHIALGSGSWRRRFGHFGLDTTLRVGLGFLARIWALLVVNTFQRSSLVGLKTSAPADGRESQTYRFVLNWEPIS